MSGQAPTGNVSLVFTDVQGSTTLWERLPVVMRSALEVHNRVLREAIDRSGGYEVKTEGDAFMAAFASPIAALRFCLDAQTSLMDADWPPEILVDDAASAAALRRGLRVRMGVHCGEPDCRPDPITGRMDYFGRVVNRAARVSAAAHGGQVLASEAVYKGVQAHLGELGSPSVLDLGEHRLKDLESADRLYQILPGPLAARSFPPLKTLDARKTNLQAHPTPFIGREPDLAALQNLFQKGERLVTLMGPGGTGKTRLSMRYAAVHLEEFTREGGGGAWFCDLTEARNVDGICAAVGAALDVPLTTGKTSADVVAQLGHALAGRGRVLLVLDNFEQVIGHAPETVGSWYRLAPMACFLVSSQERLRLPGEVPWELKPLTLPEGSDVRSSEAVQLFVERARAIRPGWILADADVEAVAGIVRELDGIPLAIELAAARIGVLPPAKILERLPRRFDLLGGARRDATSRQATLRGAIDWSWGLLKEHERDALAQCSVFHGGFTVEAAEEVVDLSAHDGAPWALDVVESLRDKSLLRAWEPPEVPGELRFGMYANIRQYAQEKLDADPSKAHATKSRHGAFYLRVGGEWAGAVDAHGGLEKLRRLALERDNLGAVFHRAKTQAPPTPESAASAFRALLALDPVLSTRGPFGVHLAWLDEAVAHADGVVVGTPLRVRILEARGRARRIRGRMADAVADFDAARALAAQSGDAAAEARILAQRGLIEYQQGDLEKAHTLLREGLQKSAEAKNSPAAAQLLGFLGSVLADQGAVAEARDAFVQSLRLLRESGNVRYEGLVLGNMGIALLRARQLGEAQAAFERALAIHRETGDRRFEGNTMVSLGNLFLDLGDLDRARSCFDDALGIHREVGNLRSQGILLGSLGILEYELGRLAPSRECLERAVALLRETGERRGEALYRGYFAAVQAELGDKEKAAADLAAGLAGLNDPGDPALLHTVELLGGIVRFAGGVPAEAVRESLQRILANPSARETSDDLRIGLRIFEKRLAQPR